MSKIKKQLLAGPYLIWIIGFIILPLFMIVYYAFKGSDGGFTFEYVAAIAQHTNIKALLLSLRLGIICTIICLVLSYPLAMILNGLKIKNQSFVVFVFMLPMWMNFMLRILAWKQLLSKNGVINSILTTLGLPGFNIMNTSGAVDIVIRPEDVELVPAEDGYMQGDVVSNIFKGVHYELEVKANGYDWMVHTTKYVEVGSHVGIKVIPFNIQVMHKPESSDEKAVEIDV